jgi:predicted O-linked N-acetylglucosamine transferase (SPINDLY family)
MANHHPDPFAAAVALHGENRLAEAEAIYRDLLATTPDDTRVLHHLGLLLAQRGALDEGHRLLAEAVRRDPAMPQVQFHRASVLLAMGNPSDALAAFSAALVAEPDRAEIHFVLGNALFQLARYGDAAEAFARADALEPGRLEVLLNWGSALQEQGCIEEAIAVCDRVLALAPRHPGALNNRGNALRLRHRNAEALAAFDAAIAADPSYDLARFNRATVLEVLRRYDEALRECDRVIVRAGGSAAAHALRGTILLGLQRPDDAFTSFERALTLQPDLAAAYHGRVKALLVLTRWEEALAACDAAIAEDPSSVTAYNNRGVALMRLRRFEDAGAAFATALSLAPEDGAEFTDALFNRAGLHNALDQFDEAFADTERVLALRPDFVPARCFRFNQAANLCDWSQRLADMQAMAGFCAAGEEVDPFALLYAYDDPQMHLDAAKRVADKVRPALTRVTIAPRKTLRIAYLSADFRDHPVTLQAIDLFEAHDRSRVETFAVALWPLPQSALGDRLRGAFSQVVEAYDRSDQDIARRLADLHVDIAVEMGGHTDKARPGVLAWRPAPISVSYLGYPGTLGMPFIDYILADGITIPPEDDRFYTESVVRLPTSFMPFDSRMVVAERTPSRAEEGLPQDGFVFADFNKTDKITPEMFSIWMRILQRVPGSVFWLNVQNTTARRHLTAEAMARDVAPERIIFAERTPGRAEHLARLKLADLFLDTLPYNAHATTSDFLAAGVPVLTCKGKSFAARVAASLLTSVGAEGLVAPDLATYETMAVELANDPQALSHWRQHLQVHKRTAADTQRLARGLEEAYFTMWDRRVKGLKPESFTVA